MVFSTKNRAPFITHSVRDSLHAYVATVLQNLGCAPVLINSVEDHIHVLFDLSVSEVVELPQEVLKTQGVAEFAWQAGYGAFSVSESNVGAVRTYIAQQRKHHRKRSFQEEFRQLLERHGVAYDERFVWS